VDDARDDLFGAELVERSEDRLDRALHVALDDQREFLSARALELAHHLLERAAHAGDAGFTLLPGAIVGDFAGAGLGRYYRGPIVSSSRSRLSFLVAETSMSSTSPPIDSTCTSWRNSSVRTRSGLASGLSILLMATIIGTFAALAWWIASIVCGITPSSAATTRMTMSVTFAPRARMAVNAAWPGVSM